MLEEREARRETREAPLVTRQMSGTCLSLMQSDHWSQVLPASPVASRQSSALLLPACPVSPCLLALLQLPLPAPSVGSIMGSWKLEVYKMCLYIGLPIGFFALFNHPAFYEQAILDARRSQAACIDENGSRMLQELFRKNQMQQMDETISQLKSQSK